MVVPLVAKKAFAAIVITLCLSLQVYAIVRQTAKRWWPFVDYPMFSAAYSVGATFRQWELRGRTCGEPPKVWTFTAHTLGYGTWAYRRRLRDIVENRTRAAKYRAEFSKIANTLAAKAAMPPPCAFEVWERAAIVTRDGFEPSSPSWAPRREWHVDDDPSVVRALLGHPPAP